MFSGIVEGKAQVVELNFINNLQRLTLDLKLSEDEVSLGESIAINGVCLTVVEIKDSLLSFDLAEETLRRTNLGGLKAGDFANFERSLALGDKISGHFVFGHVDGIAILKEITSEAGSLRFKFETDLKLMKYICNKGSVSLSGVSLTVGEVTENTFYVYLIPHTLEVTILGDLKLESKVNLEVDMLARYAANYLEQCKV